MFRFLLLLLLVGVVIVGVVVFGLVRGVTDGALADALKGTVHSAKSASCDHRGEHQWTCTVKDENGKRTGYRLRVQGHCFTAFRVKNGKRTQTAHECLGFLDRLGL